MSTITFEATPKIAEKIAVAQTIGSLSLTLRSIADNASDLDAAIAGTDIDLPDGANPNADLPGYSKAEAKEASSLDALRKASETSYFKDKDSLWVKMVVATAPAVPAMPLQQQASVRITK